MDVGTGSHIEGARPKKNACWKDCSGVKEDRGRNPAESLESWTFFGLPHLTQLSTAIDCRCRTRRHQALAGLGQAEVTAVALDAAAREVAVGPVAAAAFSPSPDQPAAPVPRRRNNQTASHWPETTGLSAPHGPILESLMGRPAKSLDQNQSEFARRLEADVWG
jgi:hypothetical protein